MSKPKIPKTRKVKSISYAAWGKKAINLNKFSQKSNESLGEFINSNRNKIKKSRIDTLRALIKYAYPQMYYGILVAEMLYKNRDAIIDSLEGILPIWSEDTPITDKLVSTGEVILDISLDVIKDKPNIGIIIQKISNKFAEQGIKVLEKEGFVKSISSNIDLSDHEERFKDLLRDTITNQTSNIINLVI